MPFDESDDIEAMLDTGDFATSALYDGATTVYVIFDREYVQAVGTVQSANPVAWGRASDFSSPTGKTLVINSVTYKIRASEPQDDGTLVLLQLEKQ